MDRPRHVLFWHGSWVYGGVEVYVELVLRHLDRSRFKPFFFWPRDSDEWMPGRLIDHVRDLNVPIVRDSPSWLARIESNLGRIQAFAGLLREERIELVHIHAVGPDRPRIPLLGAAIARVPGVVRTEHVPPRAEHGRASIRLSCRFFDRLVGRLVTVSKDNHQAQTTIMRRDPEKMRVLYNGIEVPPLTPESDRRTLKQDLGFDPEVPLIGMVGRLSEQKGHSTLLEAIPEIVDSVGTVAVAIAGEGPLAAELQARTESHPLLSQCVRFLGHVERPQGLINALDVAVMPSLYEGFSLAMLEFMAAARPCVFSDHPSFLEATGDGKFARICRMGDSGQFAQAVVRLLRDAQAAAQLGRAARQHVIDHFSAEVHVAKLMDLYDELLDGSRSEREAGVHAATRASLMDASDADPSSARRGSAAQGSS